MIYMAWRAIRDVGVTINIFSDGKRGNESERERDREKYHRRTQKPLGMPYTAPIVQSRRRARWGGETKRPAVYHQF